MDWTNVLRELVPSVAISLCFAAMIIWGVRPVVERMLPIIDHGISVVESQGEAHERLAAVLEMAMGKQQELYEHKLDDEKRERLDYQEEAQKNQDKMQKRIEEEQQKRTAMQKRIDELVEENTQLKEQVKRIPPLEEENKRLKEEVAKLRKKLNGMSKEDK